jgi:LPS O-antigen subunit length determinant protein (WzzB/FepE family)
LIGAGTIINPILKVVTTVAILGAAYIFIVKPVLDTTEHISSDVSKQTQQAFNEANQASDDFDLNFAKDRAESFASSLRSQWPEAAREVTDCVRKADKDAKAMQKCDDFGHQLITEGQSPRNFSLSYADSLSAQGKTSEAAAVEKCVDEAQFDVRDLQKCRDLADRLLFP